MITVLLVDDHPVVREGLRGMIDSEPDICVVGEAGSGSQALELVRSLRPDVVIMDLKMPGIDGVAATAAIVAGPSPSRVIILTTYDSDSDIIPAVEAGAAGYLLKDASCVELANAIRDAASGKTVLAPSLAGRLMKMINQPTNQQLSSRELEVLRLVAHGLTNSEIGADLYISEATVKTHLQRVCSKLGVVGRAAAAATAISRGLVTLEE
ncbi:response regulator [Mycobacteroides chelonae]|uniref:DNA-binding response regulator n=1 Tax=Mycobacteroides chelonae TaxID=1774 RepID=A0A1S1M4R0_MYCCH|nr:response regulator transcription factor [Mycobacteroides chelonae]OHU53294.1 DNA-binding response regulator [Mycobacteroides chelonae]OHU78220.1 DNA-binding response regulator [Mycobacteroides chelonae]QQG86591.1 response regulator transcription factor [Mycobacteroides chelonae]QQG91408.1 response regulator transcription factor [Mycobacteroides chelonae]